MANFGGKRISFAGRTETLESVFGKEGITPMEMNKKIWKHIKANNLFK